MNMRRLSFALNRYRLSERGAAAVEFAIWLTFLIPALVNGADLAMYAYDKTQATNAAQAGAQALYVKWTTCTSATPPITTSNCSGYDTAITDAISKSTYLGPKISRTTPVTDSGGTTWTDGYYCASTSGAFGSKLGTGVTTCGSGASSYRAGYYYPIKVTYTYQPIFAGVSIMSLLNTTISQIVWIRLQ